MALSHAILAALHSNPCSGYDLAKNFDGSVGFFWNASHQQIYRELSKLEENSHIEANIIHQASRPDKKIYSLTSRGYDYLSKWITTPSTVNHLKDELLVKLFAADLVDPQLILSELEHHRTQHQDRLDTYHAIAGQVFPEPEKFSITQRYQYLTLRQGIRLETEWLAWCQEAIESISKIDDRPKSS
jgi:DNA-binding PadR family transcriptional regulator